MEQLSEKSCVEESTDFLVQAQTYLLTAARAFERRRCFTAENIFTILKTSIEKFFIGFFLCNHHRPENHSMNGLVESFKLFRHLDEQLERDLLEIDGIDASSLHECSGGVLVESDYIERLFETAQHVSQLVLQKLESE